MARLSTAHNREERIEEVYLHDLCVAAADPHQSVQENVQRSPPVSMDRLTRYL